MPEATAIAITRDEEQQALLPLLVEGTAMARMAQCFDVYPQMERDATVQRIQTLKPEVVLVDLLPKEADEALRTIEVLHSACPQAFIFAIGEMSRPQLIVAAMRAGAKEFLPRPCTADQMLAAFQRFVSTQRKARSSGTRGRVYAVLNAKGGNGATTVAVNLALTVALTQGSAALIDLAPVGNAALHLNLKPGFTAMDALNNLHRLDSTLLDGYMTRHESGLHVLAGNPAVNAAEAGPAEFARLFDVLAGEYQHVVVDLSTRLDGIARVVCDLADTVLVVANPELSSLWSAAQIHDFFAGTPAEQKLRIVLNRYRKSGGFRDSDIEQATRTKILCKLPNQYAAVSGGIERGVPVARQGNTEIARGFAEMGKSLTSKQAPSGAKRWLFGVNDRLTMRTDP